jgi:DNA-binding MarR family transcriptional regulator
MAHPSNHPRRLLHGLTGAWRRVEGRAGGALRSATGLDLSDVVFLETVAMTDLSPGEIAEALRIPAHGVSRKLAALEGSGLLRRTIDPADHRRRVLALTPHGRSQLASVQATLEATLGPLFGELGAERSAALLDALTRLAAGVDPD